MLGLEALLRALSGLRGRIRRGTAAPEQELAARGTTDRLHLALQTARAGTWEWNLRTGRNAWSEELWPLYGLEPHGCEPSFEAWRQTIVPEDRDRTARAVQEAARRGAELNVEWRVRDAGGDERWLMSRGRPLRDAAGKVDRYVGIVLDVTEGKRAEEALRRYELLAGNSRDIVLFMRREDGRILEANAAALSAYGYGREEILALSINDLRAPETRPLIGAQMAVADTAGILFETVHRRKDGSTFPVEVSSRGGTVDGMRTLLSVVRDITDRKRTEDALRVSEEEARARTVQLEAILDSIADGVIVYDREGRTVRSSPAADAILRIPASERQGPVADRVMRQYEILSEDGRRMGPDEMVAVRAAVHGETVPGAIYQVRSRDGEPRWLIISGVPLIVRGKHTGAVVSLTDITEQKRAQQALREADERKNEFLAMLSHELRNPLAPIRNSVYLLEHGPRDGEAAALAPAIIRRQTEHLTRLVDDLLDVTRITRGKIELQCARIDAGDLVRRTCDDHRTLFDGRSIGLHVDVSGPVWVDADATRVAQVLGNLLQNAAKFSREGGRVTVGVAASGGQAWIRVRDDGVGIPPELLPRVFEPFVQAEDDLARTKGGLGLGLALVKGLVEAHGGTVSVRSEGPGRGSEFAVALPLAPQPRPSAPAPRPVAAIRAVEILVIEDNVDAAQSLAEVLQLRGHRVHVATDGRSGVRRAHELRPEVVLCDVGLPDVDGYQIARILRADEGLRSTRLIALSGYARPEDRERARDAGFDAHIAKPPDVDELMGLLGAAGG